MQLHFYHLEKSDQCRQHAKSETHLKLQKKIIESCGQGSFEEYSFPEIGRIADIAWPDKKLIFEVQCSQMTAEEARNRQHDYTSIGYEVIWILSEMTYNKRKVSALEATLSTTTHYFANDNSIYDQCDVIVLGRRRARFLQRPILIASIQPRLPQAVEQLPVTMQVRNQQWKWHARDDLVSELPKNKMLFDAVTAFEQGILQEGQKATSTFFSRMKEGLKALYYSLLEGFCR